MMPSPQIELGGEPCNGTGDGGTYDSGVPIGCSWYVQKPLDGYVAEVVGAINTAGSPSELARLSAFSTRNTGCSKNYFELHRSK
jgi:hypothetical protein